MSYYKANYYQNPVPYTSSDIGEPVPGWGSTTRIAGPPRVGVGAIAAKTATIGRPGQLTYLRPGVLATTRTWASQQNGEQAAPQTPPEDEDVSFIDKIPVWAFPVGAAVILVGVYYATK